MSVEEELKKDHAEMQAAVDSKQKIIDAQVSPSCQGLQHFSERVCRHALPCRAAPQLQHGETVRLGESAPGYSQ